HFEQRIARPAGRSRRHGLPPVVDDPVVPVVPVAAVDELPLPSVLPRTVGSRTIWFTTVSNRDPSGRLRLTVILTRYSPGGVSGSASIDQDQSGSSSQVASDCDESAIDPASTSAMRDWASN